jgi:1-acyl-sn-glycerol-3-phosphate acyltransferase
MKQVKQGLRYLYVGWAFFWFVTGFFICYPAFWWIMRKPKRHKYYFNVAKMWAQWFYPLIFMPVKAVWHFRIDPKQTYVFCPNHFSYLDIPLLTRTMRKFYVFVGLHDLEKIPLFGKMYQSIHITVNRASLRNRYQTYQKASNALHQGKDLVIFPEGGIWVERPPQMAKFKEGPFRIAVEQQVPIVPVTIAYNWKIMPEAQFWQVGWHRSVIVYHEPIPTTGLTLRDVPDLQARVYQIIDAELRRRCPEYTWAATL